MEASGRLQPWQPSSSWQQQGLQWGEHLHLGQDPVPCHRDCPKQGRFQWRPEKEFQANASEVKAATGSGGCFHSRGRGRAETSLEWTTSLAQLAALGRANFFYTKIHDELLTLMRLMVVKILFLFFFLPYTPKTYLHEVSFVYTSVEQTGTAVHESTLVMQLFSKSSEYQAWIITFRDNLVIEALKLVWNHVLLGCIEEALSWGWTFLNLGPAERQWRDEKFL